MRTKARKSIRTLEAPTPKADAPAHLSDEFPAGYSLTGCSPAAPASASPAGVECVSTPVQLRGFSNNGRTTTKKRNQTNRQRSTLRSQFFCPKNGETLKMPNLFGVGLKVHLRWCSFQRAASLLSTTYDPLPHPHSANSSYRNKSWD